MKLLCIAWGVFLMALSAHVFGCTLHQQDAVRIQVYSGPQARAWFSEIAALRIQLFAEFPYLYAGTVEYERAYLETYFACPQATIMLVWDNDEVVGFSSSIPLVHECAEIQEPFIRQGISLHDVLYIGEVMLRPAYRGRGFLRKFFEYHESIARALGMEYATFMTVDRLDDHPWRPQDYRDLGPVWNHFGYYRDSDLAICMVWPQVDTDQDVTNCLSVWVKSCF